MQKEENDINLKGLFVPFTSVKAIHFIILIGIVIYANSLFNGFVGDDNGQILNNPEIRSLANFPNFFKGSTLFVAEVGQSAGLYYRPMLTLTFASLYALFGAVPFPFHLFQLLLHITIAILIFSLLKRHLSMSVSFILSLLFLLHPINNEAVVYASNMQEQLFSFYGLLALNFVAAKRWLYIVPLFLLASLLSKETGVIFLPLTILYYYLFCKRDTNTTKLLVGSVFYVIILYLCLRIFVGNTGINTHFLYMSTNATYIERLYTIPSLVTYYLQTFLYPVPLAFGWYWVIKETTLMHFGYPLIFALFFLFLLLLPLYLFKHEKGKLKFYAFFLIFFALSFGLVMQLFPLDLTVADRWFYMPLFGLLALGGIIYDSLQGRYIKSKKTKIIILILISSLLIFYGIRDIIRNTNWVDSYTLCNHDVHINTKSYILEFCLANELYNRKDYKNAEVHAKKAVDLYPEYFYSWYALGKASFENNHRAKAKEAFKKALQYNEFALGSQELALIYVYEKNTIEARNITTKYLKQLPNSAQLWYALALINYTDGNYNEATAAARRAYELSPSSPIIEKVYIRLQNNLPLKF